jgi:hypothetical protein
VTGEDVTSKILAFLRVTAEDLGKSQSREPSSDMGHEHRTPGNEERFLTLILLTWRIG